MWGNNLRKNTWLWFLLGFISALLGWLWWAGGAQGRGELPLWPGNTLNIEGFPFGDFDTSTCFYSSFSWEKYNDFRGRESQHQTESKINLKCFYLMEMNHFDTVKTNWESWNNLFWYFPVKINTFPSKCFDFSPTTFSSGGRNSATFAWDACTRSCCWIYHRELGAGLEGWLGKKLLSDWILEMHPWSLCHNGKGGRDTQRIPKDGESEFWEKSAELCRDAGWLTGIRAGICRDKSP